MARLAGVVFMLCHGVISVCATRPQASLRIKKAVKVVKEKATVMKNKASKAVFDPDFDFKKVGEDIADCTPEELRKAAELGPEGKQECSEGQLQAYFVDFAANKDNAARLQCQLGASFCPLTLEEATITTQEQYEKWVDEGLVARDNKLSEVEGPAMKPKYAGIYMNHLNIWTRHAQDGPEQEWVGVVESDGAFRWDFHHRMKALTPQLDATTMDIVYLGHVYDVPDCKCILPHRKDSILDLGNNVKACKSYAPLGSHGYLISRKGAEILRNFSHPIYRNNDEFPMLELVKNGTLRSLSICPNLVRQDWHPYSVGLPVYKYATKYMFFVLLAIGFVAAVVRMYQYLRSNPLHRKQVMLPTDNGF